VDQSSRIFRSRKCEHVPLLRRLVLTPMTLTEGIASPELGKRTRTKAMVLRWGAGNWTSPSVVFSCRRYRVHVRYSRALSKTVDPKTWRGRAMSSSNLTWRRKRNGRKPALSVVHRSPLLVALPETTMYLYLRQQHGCSAKVSPWCCQTLPLTTQSSLHSVNWHCGRSLRAFMKCQTLCLLRNLLFCSRTTFQG
jgi:hypothetical protein